MQTENEFTIRASPYTREFYEREGQKPKWVLTFSPITSSLAHKPRWPPYPTLPPSAIRARWPGYREAGDTRTGCWAVEPIPYRRYQPPLKKFIQLAMRELRTRECPVLAEIGCGNGTRFAAGAAELLAHLPNLNLILTDKQPLALAEAKSTYEKTFGGKYKTPVFVQADISVPSVTQKITQANEGKQVDTIVCMNALGFLTNACVVGKKDNRLQVLHDGVAALRDVLMSKGLGFILVHSIYNPASVGSEGNQQALRIVRAETNGGTTERPIAFYQPEMQTSMFFFTERSLCKILRDHGFEVLGIGGYYNLRQRNGLGN